MSKFFGGGLDPYNGTVFLWFGKKFHVLAGIPDQDSVYVRMGSTVLHQVSGKMQIGRHDNASEET